MKLFGDGGARQRAEQQRRVQQVANDRQLAQLQQEDQGTKVGPRRRPRGRRLFADEGGKSNLS